MRANTNIYISYSFSNKTKKLDTLISALRDHHNITLLPTISNAKNERELGDIIFEYILKSHYFLRIIPDQRSKWTDQEFTFAMAEQVRTKNLKIVNIQLDKIKDIKKVVNPSSITIDFTRDFNSAFGILLGIINYNSSSSLVSLNLEPINKNGSIIKLSSKVNQEMINYFIRNPNEMKTMDRRLFEEFIADIFNSFGYDVELTQQTRDGGRDIIAIKNAETHSKYLIECKRPDPGNLVGIRPVRELFGVKNDEKATKAILATTSYFSPDANLFFERNKWEMEKRDYDGILSWIKEYKRINNIPE